MATRSPGYNRLGLSIILSSLSPVITGDFFFLPLYPIPLLSATKSPALSCPSDCAKRESFISAFILPPTCCAKRESFSLHTFFFSQKESAERLREARATFSLSASILLPACRAKRESFSLRTFFFSQKESTERPREARAPPPPFWLSSCCRPVARSVKVFLCILSFFLKKKVWEIPTKYGIMERIDEHLFRAAGGTQFF